MSADDIIPQLTDYNIPLDFNEHAVMRLPIPLTETQWEQLQSVLQAFKPGWIVAPTDEQTGRPPDSPSNEGVEVHTES